MRRRLFDWHLTLGLFGGFLMLVWSLSGGLMILDPVLRRAFDAKPPKVAARPVDAAAFSFPAARLPAAGAEAVSLRSFGGRSWYEVRWKGGKTAAFDSATGGSVPAELTPEEARGFLDAELGPKGWRAASVERLAQHDDHYRSGELPVLRAVMIGPGSPWYYLSSRDGSSLKSATLAARGLRWAGFGVHTWNAAVIKRSADDARRFGLALLVALPLASLAAVSLWLYWLRRADLLKQVPQPRFAPGKAARVVAALSALVLAMLAPGQAAAQAVARVAAVPAAVRVSAAVFAGPLGGAPRLGYAAPSGLSVVPAPALTLPRPAAAPAAAAVPAAPVRTAAASAAPAVLAAPRAEAWAVVSAPAAVPAVRAAEAFAAAPADGRASVRTGARAPAALDLLFDGRRAAAGSAVGVAASAQPAARPALAPRDGVLASPPSGQEAPAVPSVEGRDRKALWGIYATHAAHLLTMSAAWRVAWPLLAIELIGKGGLATVGSFGALVEMGTGLVAGVLVDRFLPRGSMASAAVLRAALGAGIAAAAGLGLGSVPLLLGAFVAHSFALTTIHIGQSAAAPEAAGGEPGALQRVNAVLKVITAAVSIPGALAGGWLAATYGAGAVLLGYAAANLVVLAPLYWLLLPRTAPRRAQAAPAAAPAGGLWDAAKLVAKSRVLLAALAAMAAGVLLTEPLRSVTLPIMVGDLTPAAAAMLLGGFQAAYAGGQLVANLALVRWGARLPERAWLWLGAAGLASFGLFALGGAWVGFSFAAAAAVGFLTQPLSVSAKTLYQTEVRRLRPELLGRAMGLNNIAYRLAVSAGTALVGWAAVTGGAWGLGSTATLAAVYGGLAVLTLAGVSALLGRRQPLPPAPAAAPPASPREGTTKLGGFALLPLLGLSALEWHMTLGAFTGVVMIYMAVTGSVTVLAPLIKKRFDPKLPKAPPPPPAPPPIAAAEAKAKAEAWLNGSGWRLKGDPELMKAYDEHYKSGELPVYRVELDGPGGFIAYLSGRDGRTVSSVSRMSRVLRWAGLTLHTFGFGLLKSKYDTARRLAIPAIVALPVVLTILAAMLSRFL